MPRSLDSIQWEVWITPEASRAINEAAEAADISRGLYMQNAIWEGIKDHTSIPRDQLLYPPLSTTMKHLRLANPRPGYNGRWAKWVRVRCTVTNPVPMMLTRIGREQGHASASAYTRHLLALAIKRDLGRTVPMPPGRVPAHSFGASEVGGA